MHIHIGRNGHANKLSRPVREYLRKRYTLSNDYLNRLRCFQLDGILYEKPVRRIRIFDPVIARQQGNDIRTSMDLDRYKGVITFEGHVNENGKLYFADRRPPLYLQNPA